MKYIIIDKGIQCFIRECNWFTVIFWIIYCKIKKYRYIIKE